MPKPQTATDRNTQPNLTANIRPGQVSPAQKQAWKRFWQRIIAEAKSEVQK